MSATDSLCHSNAEWLTKQIDYATQRFREACTDGNEALADFWENRWLRLERHYKNLREA